MNAFQEARRLEEQIVQWRRQIHRHPEVGQALTQTAGLVRSKLEEWEVEYREVIPNAFMAYIGPKGGKSVLLRADMDALPMDEQTGLPFASECPGAMHSCGHDTHTAMLLGAAKILKDHESELTGQAILMFQPDEEGLTGARDMIAAGCLKDPKPDRAVAIHISADALKTGQLSIRSGVCMASSDGFRIRLHGKGGHGASPEDSISPVYAGVKLIGAFADIARYELDPQQPAVVNICAVHTGSTYNIIPNDCEIMGTVRTFNEKQRARLLERLQQAMNQVAALYRCTAEWHIGQSAPSTHSDEQFSARLHQLLSRDLPEIDLIPLQKTRGMGSEDFSFVTQQVPSAMVSLGSTSPQGQAYPMHHPKVVFDEKTFVYGTAAYVQIALSYFADEE